MQWLKCIELKPPYSSATEKTQFLEVFNELNKNLSHDLLPKVEDTNRKINVDEIDWQSYIYFNDWKKTVTKSTKINFLAVHPSAGKSLTRTFKFLSVSATCFVDLLIFFLFFDYTYDTKICDRT